MAKFEPSNIDEGWFITDINVADISRIDTKVRRLVKETSKDFDEDIEVGGLYIVGSWARGLAKPRESDVDIVVEFINPNGEELKPGFDFATTVIIGRMQDRSEFWKPMGFKTVFDDIDFIDTIPKNKWVVLERFTREQRDRPVGKRQVYNLTKGEYISAKKIREKTYG